MLVKLCLNECPVLTTFYTTGKPTTRTFVKTEVNINKHVNNRDETLLMLACKEGNYELVKALIVHMGVDLDAQSKRLFTALYMAVANGHFNIVEFLIDAGAKINFKNNNQDMTLVTAINNCNNDGGDTTDKCQIIKLLLCNGIQVNNSAVIELKIWKAIVECEDDDDLFEDMIEYYQQNNLQYGNLTIEFLINLDKKYYDIVFNQASDVQKKKYIKSHIDEHYDDDKYKKGCQ